MMLLASCDGVLSSEVLPPPPFFMQSSGSPAPRTGNAVGDDGAKCLAAVRELHAAVDEAASLFLSFILLLCLLAFPYLLSFSTVHVFRFPPPVRPGLQLISRAASLRHLNASACGIEDAGAVSIAMALAKNRSLRTLDLRSALAGCVIGFTLFIGLIGRFVLRYTF